MSGLETLYLEDLFPEKLLSSGLRVSTPPTRRSVSRRLQLVPDENNPPSPPFAISATRFLRGRTPLDDQDTNSQDSGCTMSCSSEDSQRFRFLEPCGVAPKRLNSMESPRRCLQFPSFPSGSSDNSNSLDEGCWEVAAPLPECDLEDSPRLPTGLGSLLNGRIFEPSPRKKPLGGNQALSDNSTPQRRKKSLTFMEDLKRPLADATPKQELSPQKHRIKRVKSYKDDHSENQKGTLFEYGFWKSATPEPDVKKFKSTSDSEINIKLALQRSTQEELIGNFTKPFVLPLVSGKHQDLKTITCDTLADLINGKYEDCVASFKIIDCRYPYEFDGGHIKGAINLFTCAHISKELLESKSKPTLSDSEQKRDILIFHCEFSSERGPFLSRFLRKEDRAGNEYPNLYYPEIYLLQGGYSEFFKSHEEMCDPKSYRMMQDPAHVSDLKHFRAKSKSWAPGNHRKLTVRSLTRLGF